MIKNQQGLSFWGVIWGAVLVACVALLLVKSIPPYLNNQKLVSALEALASEPDIMDINRASMLRRLERRLNIEYGDDIVNLKQTFQVKDLRSQKELSIDYELAVPLAYNISLLFEFENHVIAPLK